jgi:DNA invertase Pin-like site-specific DNA recombinase
MRADRITPQHLQRTAIVYVRQSSPEQVRSHAESTRIQIGLHDQAVAFGWPKPVTILDDLGVSAAGFAHRPGFQHLVAEVSLGHVGMILCFEASRLSRNSKDWAQLFELCGLLATLVADLDQVYDLSLPDDRLILGVKGSISEYELTLFRQRSQQAIRAKAQRGALQFTLPAGLGWTPDGQIERHPDRRVQQAIRMVFDKLLQFGSVRQVLMWLRDEHLSLPTLEHERPRAITWRPPTYRMVLSIVRSPFYAGAYAFGRRESRTRVVAGRVTRTHGHAKPISRWTALIRDHHPGYISWEQFERNQQRLEENAHMKGTIARQAARGAILGYLAGERLAAPTDLVFLTPRTPVRPIGTAGVRDVVCRAIERAGVPAPSRGPHILRHSLATRLLRDGAALDTIGAVLRHRDVNTTALYAKVDLAMLAQVAQPWPATEEGSSC